MKKMLFCLIAVVSFTACMISCGHGTASTTDTDSTTAVTDSLSTDSDMVDSVAVDSVK